MVKAIAGGGGRGIRPVTRAAELAGAMRRCASEAQAAFGDSRVYVEQLLTRARHIEIQVIGDGTLPEITTAENTHSAPSTIESPSTARKSPT